MERCAGASCTTFAQIATPAATAFSDTTVVGATTYRYRVLAVDAIGNLGPSSNIANVTTPATADTQAPSAPGTLSGSATGATQISLTWGAATDNVAVTGYRVERCTESGCTSFTQIGTPSSTTYTDSSVVANTTYVFRVRAVDAAVNLGPYLQ